MPILRLPKSSAPPAPDLRFSLMSFIGVVIAIGATGWLSLTTLPGPITYINTRDNSEIDN